MLIGRNFFVSAIFLATIVQSTTSVAQDFNIDAIANTIINNQSLHDWQNRNVDNNQAAEPIPIAAAAEVTELACSFDTPTGWTRVGAGTVEGQNGIGISVFCEADIPSGQRSVHRWLKRRIEILFAGREIVEQSREPEWTPADQGDVEGVWRLRLLTAGPDGQDDFHLIQTIVNSDYVMMSIVSAPDDLFSDHAPTISDAHAAIVNTLNVERVRTSLQDNPVTSKLPAYDIDLPGVAWEMQPGMKHVMHADLCAWQCTTFDKDPEIVVHEPLPLSPRAAIETLAATWDDPVVDRIRNPMLQRWFAGTNLKAELLHEKTLHGFTGRRLLIPLTDGERTVLVEMRGKEAALFDRLPTVLAFIDTMRLN